MVKSMCCKADMIYLGKGKGPINVFLGGVYTYCCSKCGMIEWSTEREQTKYVWYKYDSDKLSKLLKEWL